MRKTEDYSTACTWLQELFKKISKIHPDGFDWRDPGHLEIIRGLTRREWAEVKRLVLKHEFPCLLFPTAYSFQLTVYGFPLGCLRSLIQIQCSQFPYPSSARRESCGQSATLKWLEPILYRDRNVQLLRRYKLPSLERLEEYVY